MGDAQFTVDEGQGILKIRGQKGANSAVMTRTRLSLLTIFLLLALTFYAATTRSDSSEIDSIPQETAPVMRAPPANRHLVGIAYPSEQEPFILSSFEHLLPGDPDPLADITGPMSLLTAERWMIRAGGDSWHFFLKQGDDHPGEFEIEEAGTLDSDYQVAWLIAEDYDVTAEAATFRPYLPPYDPIDEIRELLSGSLLPQPTVEDPSRAPSALGDFWANRTPLQDPGLMALQDNPMIIALIKPDPEEAPLHTGIYTGRGSHDEGIQAIKNFLDHHDIPWSEFDETTPGTGSLGDNFDLIWFPSGFSEEYRWYVQGHEKIRDFVSEGGGFIGVCAGAFYASATMLWQDGDGSDYPLNLFDGKAIGPLGTPVYWGEPASLLLTDDQPANSSLDPVLDVYYLDGPYFSAGPDQAVEILAQYEANDEAAVISFQYGEGTVLLMGPHPELGYDAEAGVFDVDGGSGAQWPWLYSMFRSLFVP